MFDNEGGESPKNSMRMQKLLELIEALGLMEEAPEGEVVAEKIAVNPEEEPAV